MQWLQQAKLNWQFFYGNSFRLKFQIFILLILIVVLFLFQYFFQFIEQRNGIVLNDFILNYIPAVDMSIYIFLCIWIVVALFIFQSIQNPDIFFTFSIAYLLLCITRIIAIYTVPLNAPFGLIELADPLTNQVYGGGFITKDLFFSGHVSTQFLFFLCFQKKIFKTIAFISTILVAIFVLIQHVHYTIDVLAAPIFCYIIYLITQRIKRLPQFEYKAP